MKLRSFLPNLGACLLLLLLAGTLRGGSLEADIVWVEGKPHVELVLETRPVAELAEVQIPVEVFDAQGSRVWQTGLKLPLSGEPPWRVREPIANVDPAKSYVLKTRMRHAALEIDMRQELHFAAETSAVASHGLLIRGAYPQRRVWLLLNLRGGAQPARRDIPLSLTLRDASETVIESREVSVKVTQQPPRHRWDVTPKVAQAVGPFSLEVSIEDEASGLYFNAAYRFGQPNAVVPVSSMEHGDPGRWFTADGAPQRYQTLQYYYSDHLRDLVRRDYPRLAYDREQKRSGQQSLRIDYEAAREAHAWSLQTLPGKPIELGIWVRGNSTNDSLWIRFEDHINYALPAWERNANFEEARICTLDFEGWRRFRVPVLGDGLQVDGMKGSTKEIDAPVRIMALSIRSGPLPEGVAPGQPRSVWIDDLEVQTQVAPTDRLTLETRLSDREGRLTDDAVLSVSVGNGFATALERGKLNVLARDGSGQEVYTATADLQVPAEGFAVLDLPIEALARRKPLGPVDIEVTFVDAGAAARVQSRITLKSTVQGGVFHDFEEPQEFSGYQPGSVTPPRSRIEPGGADGAGHALVLPIASAAEPASALFHPALPGIVDRVEMMVRGGPRPATLQVWFIDSGFTGIWIRPYNLFWAEPITVDWQGWRKVSIPAPPVPAHYGDKNRYFLFKPWYPLNLAVSAALVEGEEPSEVRIDDVRVVTHLPPEEALRVAVEYLQPTRLHAPGAPLRLTLTNYDTQPRSIHLRHELRNYQGHVSDEGRQTVEVPAGGKQKLELISALAPGIYHLHLSNDGQPLVDTPVVVLDARPYFGENASETIRDLHHLRRTLGLTTERIYLDWDNTEGAPYMHRFDWFYTELRKKQEAALPAAGQALLAEQQALRGNLPRLQQELQQAQRNVEQARQQAQAAQTQAAAAKEVLQAALTKAKKAQADDEAAEAKYRAALQAAQLAERAAQRASAAAELPPPKAEQPAEFSGDPARDPRVPERRAAAEVFKKQAEDLKQAATVEGTRRMQVEQTYKAVLKMVDDARKKLEADEQTLAQRCTALEAAQGVFAAATASLDQAKARQSELSSQIERLIEQYTYRFLPVVGFSADWAGPEAQEQLRRGAYKRFIPNLLQVPVHVEDWSLFVRTLQREYKKRFDTWVFWENPDLDDAPQYLPPEKYVQMLRVFHHWVKLYNPQAKVVAGGLNFSKALDYLDRLENPHELPLDEIAVQMNLGELAPEHADIEGFLDELNDLLQVRQRGRNVRVTELDWGIGAYLSPLEQAAYHARAALILDSRGAGSHQFNVINTGFEFEGYGVFWRVPYGNTGELQTHFPYHVAKPAYFALIQTRRFLEQWRFARSVLLPDRSLDDNRAFVYRDDAGRLAVVLWRAVGGQRVYLRPESWHGSELHDVFGFPLAQTEQLRLTALPLVVYLPAGSSLEQVVQELRTLAAVDGTWPVLVDLHTAEPSSAAQYEYAATGEVTKEVRHGKIPGGHKIREEFLFGVETESFTFNVPASGSVLLKRRWYFDGQGQRLWLRVDDGEEWLWDCTQGQGNDPGIRETTFLLRNLPAGAHRLSVRHESPANTSGYRLEPQQGDHVPLARWGVLNTRQTKGEIARWRSVVGTPLTIGKETYEDGIGAHAVSFIEYPLDGRLDRLEVTVGIDGSTEGRGSAVFRVFVDGQQAAQSGIMNGFSKPKTLVVDKLRGAKRLILSVLDAGDGNQHDLTNWVDGKLFLSAPAQGSLPKGENQ